MQGHFKCYALVRCRLKLGRSITPNIFRSCLIQQSHAPTNNRNTFRAVQASVLARSSFTRHFSTAGITMSVDLGAEDYEDSGHTMPPSVRKRTSLKASTINIITAVTRNNTAELRADDTMTSGKSHASPSLTTNSANVSVRAGGVSHQPPLSAATKARTRSVASQLGGAAVTAGVEAEVATTPSKTEQNTGQTGEGEEKERGTKRDGSSERMIPRVEVLRILRQQGALRRAALESDALRPVVTDGNFTKVLLYSANGRL